MADRPGPLDEDRFLLAGEYALGVLEGADLSEARRAVLADRDFADAVEWWEWRLSRMAEGAGTLEPSADVWPGIVARIEAREAVGDAVPASMPRASGPSKSSLIAFGSAAMLALAALVFLLSVPQPDRSPLPQPEPSPILPSTLLVAQLQDEEAGRRVSGLVDPEARILRLDIAGLNAEPGRTAELWVIPQGGDPVSLGFVPQEGRVERGISAEEATLLDSGATLAVTFEDDGGVRHTSPTLPIVLSGPLSAL